MQPPIRRQSQAMGSLQRRIQIPQLPSHKDLHRTAIPSNDTGSRARIKSSKSLLRGSARLARVLLVLTLEAVVVRVVLLRVALARRIAQRRRVLRCRRAGLRQDGSDSAQVNGRDRVSQLISVWPTKAHSTPGTKGECQNTRSLCPKVMKQ